jgi:hypothetical protein
MGATPHLLQTGSPARSSTLVAFRSVGSQAIPPDWDDARVRGHRTRALGHRMADERDYTPLPAETGPVWAPDRLSVWPVEGGRFGIDAHYHGVTGVERAHVQQSRLQKLGLAASVKHDADGALIRIGPLAHAPTWLALEAFLGRPL